MDEGSQTEVEIPMKSSLRHTTASVLIVAVFSMGLPAPARAGIVGTEVAVGQERIAAVLEREELLTRLAAYGVDPEVSKARVAALSDAEAIRLAAELDGLPAGAGGGGEAFPVVILAAYFVAEILPVILVVGGVVLIAKAISAGRSN